MSVCRTNPENIRIEPVYAAWNQQELFKVTCVADVADNLNETYFTFSSPTANFFAWIDTDMGMAPTVSGATGIAVTADTNWTAVQIAGALRTAVNANANFNAALDPCDPTSVYIQCVASGAATDAADGLMTNATGFTIEVIRQGAELELGFIDGDIELALTEDLLDVTAHQTGTQIIQALRTGRNIANISMSLKESDVAKLTALIETSGTSVLPSEGGATAVSAWGSEDAKAFGGVIQNCRKLVLHPVRVASSDLTKDFCLWRAYPLLTGIVLSGENNRMINVEFKIMPDPLLKKVARQFVYGDHSQNFLGE